MKKTSFLPWLVVLIALLPAAYLLLIWPSLPQTVPVHFGADMMPDRTGSKAELFVVTGILAVVSVGLYFLLTHLQRFDPKRKGAPPSETFRKLATGLVVFLAALNVLIIVSARDGKAFQGLLFPLVGLMFAFLGNYMHHIKPNYFAGFRLPWTLSSNENWRRTHELGGKLWFAGGLLIAVVCLFLKPPVVLYFFGAVAAVMVAVPVIYSYRLFKKGC